MRGKAQAVFAAVVLDDELPQVAQQSRAADASGWSPRLWTNACLFSRGMLFRVGRHLRNDNDSRYGVNYLMLA
jgi:hypothetical protein